MRYLSPGDRFYVLDPAIAAAALIIAPTMGW